MREKIVTSSNLFETRAIPLLMVPVIALLFFWMIILVYGLVRYPAAWQQTGFTSAAITIFLVFWGSLLCFGLISLIFYKIRIEDDGIIFQTPWVRIFKNKFFPMYLRFDDIHIKSVWGGRILGFTSGEELGWIRRITFCGGNWVMPYKWKKTMEVIKDFKPSL